MPSKKILRIAIVDKHQELWIDGAEKPWYSWSTQNHGTRGARKTMVLVQHAKPWYSWSTQNHGTRGARKTMELVEHAKPWNLWSTQNYGIVEHAKPFNFVQ